MSIPSCQHCWRPYSPPPLPPPRRRLRPSSYFLQTGPRASVAYAIVISAFGCKCRVWRARCKCINDAFARKTVFFFIAPSFPIKRERETNNDSAIVWHYHRWLTGFYPWKSNTILFISLRPRFIFNPLKSTYEMYFRPIYKNEFCLKKKNLIIAWQSEL